MKAETNVSGVEREELCNCDQYTGSMEALIARNLASRDQFPGQAGNGKFMCTFRAGQRVKQGSTARMAEDYLQIRRVSGGRFVVIKGISAAEEKRRNQEFDQRHGLGAFARREQADYSEAEQAGMRLASLGGAFSDAFAASPAHFNVGDRVMCCKDDEEEGFECKVIEAFGWHAVRNEGMRLGYIIRSDGERYFVPAFKLLDKGYEVRHLRLVTPPPPLAGEVRS